MSEKNIVWMRDGMIVDADGTRSADCKGMPVNSPHRYDFAFWEAHGIEFRQWQTPAPPVEKPVVWVKQYRVTGLYERCQEDGLWGIWASYGDNGMPLESWEKYLADVVEVREWKPPTPAVCPVTGKKCDKAIVK